MTALVSAKIYFFSHSFLQCLFCLFPHRKLVEEGSNLRSYRSNTTLTMLPICPHQDCSCCIRRYPYLWYPPNISFFLSFTHHVKELFFFVSLFLFDVANIWKLFLISKFWSNFFFVVEKETRVTCMSDFHPRFLFDDAKVRTFFEICKCYLVFNTILTLCRYCSTFLY